MFKKRQFMFGLLVVFFTVTLMMSTAMIRTYANEPRIEHDNEATEADLSSRQRNEEAMTVLKSEEVLLKVDFEEDLGGFISRGVATLERSSEHTQDDGTYSMRIFDRGEAAWNGAQLDLTSQMVPGGTYRFVADIYGPNQERVDYVMSAEIVDTFEVSSFPWIANEQINKADDWVSLEGTFTIPTNFTSFQLNLETAYNDLNGIGQEFYVDRLVIYEVDIPSEGTPGPEEEDSERTLIFNQDFESHLGGFASRGVAAVTRSTDCVREGSTYSMKISERGSENWHGAQTNITRFMVPNGEYLFEAYVFGEVSAEYIMSLHITGANVNPEGGDTYFPWVGHATVEGEWTRLTGLFTAPANFDSIQLGFETVADGIRPDIYVDFVSIYALGDTTVPDSQGGLDLSLPALREVYGEYFTMGNIYTPATKLDRRQDLLLHHFDLITAENIMKPGYMQPAPGVFAFDLANEMLDFAEENDLYVIGHTLVWHQQSIDWIEGLNPTREEAIEIMKNHIETVMRHFMERNPGRIIAWDVVNEAIIEDNSQDAADWRANLRDTKWLRLIGPEYIQIAFEHAHYVDPTAILYYNDYNLNHLRKSTSVYHMVKELREEGVPIHRIGMQGHYNTRTPITSVRNSLQLFSQIDGIGVSFTELDVTILGAEESPFMTEEQGILQGQVYAQLFQIFKEFGDLIQRVTIWGIEDSGSWRADRFPTLFNADLSAKPAFYGVADPDAFLTAHPVPEFPEPERAFAVNKTPIIGEFDELVWAKTEPIRVNNQLTAWEGATAEARMLWDEDHIFVLMDVMDGLLNDDAKEVHNQDSVEVFLSEYNTRSPFYLEGDSQFRVSFRNNHSFGSQGPVAGFQSAVELTPRGYRVEMKIPLQSPGYAGRVVGFDLQVNDANAQGVRQSVAKWNDLTDMSWQSTENWGLLELY